MTTFNTWTAANGQVRVYINNMPSQRSAKVWIEACAADQFGFEYVIRATSLNMNRSELGNLINDAEQEVFQAAQARVKTFAGVLTLANK